MRFDIRFRNGLWTLFDHTRFEAVKGFTLLREAEAALKRALKI